MTSGVVPAPRPLQDDGGKKLNEVLDSVGLGVVSEQLKDLQLGELLDTPPPGVDEAVAISKVGRAQDRSSILDCASGESTLG